MFYITGNEMVAKNTFGFVSRYVDIRESDGYTAWAHILTRIYSHEYTHQKVLGNKLLPLRQYNHFFVIKDRLWVPFANMV